MISFINLGRAIAGFEQLAQPEMQGPRRIPSTLILIIIFHILPNAFHKVVPHGLTRGIFAEFWLNSVVTLAGQPIQLR
jgi:hypothetical protein